jgi:uncharacterized protein HemY
MLQFIIGWALLSLALLIGIYLSWTGGYVLVPSEDRRNVMKVFSFVHYISSLFVGLLIGQFLLHVGVRLIAYCVSATGLWSYDWISVAISLPFIHLGI